MTGKHWKQIEKILNRFPQIYIKIISLGYDEPFTVQLYMGNKETDICASAADEMGLDFAMEEFTDFLVEQIDYLYKEIK